MTYVGEPAELNYTFNPREAFFTQGNQVAFGPLMYSEYQGWDSGVQVQNLSAVHRGEGEGVLPGPLGRDHHDAGGLDLPARQPDVLPAGDRRPAGQLGGFDPSGEPGVVDARRPAGAAREHRGIATLIKYTDAARSDTAEAIAYNLLPEHKIYDWQIGLGGGRWTAVSV
jgi:hypothetical protein